MPPRRTIRIAIRRFRAADAAFWLVLTLAVSVGGLRAVEGVPAFARLLVPPGLMAAEASAVEPAHVAWLPLEVPAQASPFAPAVLSPVAAHAMPEWLAWRVRYAKLSGQRAAPAAAPAPPAIAIVIDDLGNDPDAARRAIALPAAVSLAFLPYPDETPELARAAERAGHEVLVHVPMEPDGNADPGPMALSPELPAAEIVRRLDWALSRVPGYAGINNHMGSRFTQSRTALIPVIERLAAAHVFFLDSRTTPDSQVVPLSRALGVASAARDVFLDDVETRQAVDGQLAVTEEIARRGGVAIAIGHPHAVTLDALAAFAARAAADGYALVPASAAIRRKTVRDLEASK